MGVVVGLLMYFALFVPGPVSGDLGLVRGDKPGLRVLLVGTTLTSDNDMPRTLRRLGESDGGAPAIFAVRSSRGAARRSSRHLARHG